MLYFPTIISVLEVLAVTVPVLLTVAFVTIAERKTMASMQRRLGPNAVGCLTWNLTHKRTFHSSCDALSELYCNRKAPVIEFSDDVLFTSTNLLNPSVILSFFKSLKGKGGIYMFRYKKDPKVFYIGRTKDFHKRFKDHLSSNLKDRFHKFANSIGWDQFEFSIIEICDLSIQQDREDFYLQKYLPLLNTIFKSNFSEIQSYDSLYEILRLRQSKFDSDNKDLYLYVYEYCNNQISTNYLLFSSISASSKEYGIARETISVYLNTYVPYKNLLFLTNKIECFDLAGKLVSDAMQGLNLNHNIAKKIWMYFIESKDTVVKTELESKSAVAKLLGVQHLVITNHLDKLIKGGIHGHYIFNHELNDLELEKLIEFSSLRKTRNRTVWAYNAITLELITDSFNSIQKAAEFFNVDYRSVVRHLDTELATKKGNYLVLFFNDKLTDLKRKELLNNLKLAKNETTEIWVYKKLDDKFILMNSNETGFSSKHLAAKELKLSHKTISKFLNTHKDYKGLYFYSIKL